MAIRYPIPILLSGTNIGRLSGSCDGTYRIPGMPLKEISNLLVLTQKEIILGRSHLVC